MSTKLNSNVKSISPTKYNRMFWWNDSVRGMAYYSVPDKNGNIYASQVARSAFMRGDFLYMQIACKKQDTNNLKTVCIRVNKAEEYSWDKFFTAFHPSPNLYPIF